MSNNICSDNNTIALYFNSLLFFSTDRSMVKTKTREEDTTQKKGTIYIIFSHYNYIVQLYIL